MFSVNAEKRHILAYGTIGSVYENGITEQDFLRGLDALDGQDMTLVLQSDGGHVAEGLSIYNQLSEYPGAR